MVKNKKKFYATIFSLIFLTQTSLTSVSASTSFNSNKEATQVLSSNTSDSDNDSEVILSKGVYENDNAALNFVGEWTKLNDSKYSGASAMFSESKGSYVEFKFKGTGFTWIGSTTPNRGIAKITVDDKTYTSDSSLGNVAYSKKLYTLKALDYGVHTVKIEVDTKNEAAKSISQVIDSIEVIDDTQTVLKPGIYEDNDPVLMYTGNWIDNSVGKHSNGTSKFCQSAGSYVEFNFEGTGFSWYGATTPNRGIAEVTLDEQVYDVDTSSSTSAYRQNLCTIDKLSYGKHSVKISVADNKNDTSTSIAQSLDFIEIIDNNKILEKGTYEEDNKALNFVGNWSPAPNAKYSNGNALISNTEGDYLEFKFSGTGFIWNGSTSKDRGIAKVTIDGMTTPITSTVNTACNDASYRKALYKIDTLGYGTHSVKIELTGDKNEDSKYLTQVVDNIEILDATQTILKPGIYEENDPALRYTSNWLSRSNSNYSSDNGKFSSNAEDAVEFKFEGTGFSWYGPQTLNRGIAQITVDGKSYDVDTSTTNPGYKRNLYTIDNLDSKVHTVKIQTTDKKNNASSSNTQVIDFIEILDSTKVLKAGTYEEDNRAFDFVGDWANSSNAKHSNSSAKMSIIEGSYVTFKFEGTGFSWIGSTTKDRGIAKVTIDGYTDGPTYDVDTSSSTSGYQQELFSINTLPFGVHTVKIEVTNKKNATSNSIGQVVDCIKILDATSAVLEPGIYEEDNPLFIYTGNWTNVDDPKDSASKAKASMNTGASVTFNFYGTGFSWFGPANINRGIAKVTVDGKEYDADTSFEPGYKKELYTLDGLTLGKHTAKIEITDNKNENSNSNIQYIDFIEILDSTKVLSAGTYEDDNIAFKYTGNWINLTGSNYNGNSSKFSSDAGSSIEFKINGTGFTWYGSTTQNRGIANVIIDGVSYQIDTASAQGGYKKALFSIDDLNAGKHTIKIEVTNNKNANSAANSQSFDFIKVR
ncbi:MAG: hypothetical protein E7214_02935 [Clostridium sp.]|nr:hypothetical protein [Clostridium sp.]